MNLRSSDIGNFFEHFLPLSVGLVSICDMPFNIDLSYSTFFPRTISLDGVEAIPSGDLLGDGDILGQEDVSVDKLFEFPRDAVGERLREDDDGDDGDLLCLSCRLDFSWLVVLDMHTDLDFSGFRITFGVEC